MEIADSQKTLVEKAKLAKEMSQELKISHFNFISQLYNLSSEEAVKKKFIKGKSHSIKIDKELILLILAQIQFSF